MPRRNRSYSRHRAASNHTLRNIFIIAAIAVVVIVIFALAANPQPPVSAAGFPAREMGNSNAKVVVEEFADFQCPYCAMFNSVAESRLRSNYVQTGKVRFIFRNYIVVGAESNLAANAALCAGDQDAFWEYHDLLYKNQGAENSGAFSSPRLESFAAQLNLDGVKFDQCLGNQAHADIINGDIQLGHRYGIDSTPSFFINGRQVNINPQDTQFQELFDAIDKTLQS
ncbi:MAG: thioredoxin domain-containing protein [Anaerolineales bacterium]